MPLVVCIDTNVFVRETHLLRKKAGPPLIHFLRASSGRFFMPQILRQEYLEQTVAAIAEHRQEIVASYDCIQSLAGQRDDFQVPSDEQSLDSAEYRLRELQALTLDLPLTDELLSAAGRRVLAKKPPTSKSDHGFKDCLIWESILSLQAGMEVRLITRDNKAFLTDGFLSAALEAEAHDRGIHVVASKDLETVLKELQQGGSPGFDAKRALEALHMELAPVRDKVIRQWSLSYMGGESHTEFEPFYTEEAARLYMTFRLRYKAGAATFNGTQYPGENWVEFVGSFSWYPADNTLKETQVEQERLISSEGSLVAENRTIFARGAIVSGRRLILYQVRAPLLGGP